MANPLQHYERYRAIIDDFDAFSEAVRRPTPQHVRVNTLRVDIPTVVRNLEALGYTAVSEPYCPELLRVERAPVSSVTDTDPGPGRKLTLMGATLDHALGNIYSQSASSAVAAVALEVEPGMEVLDLCAAPGSKTTFIAQKLEGRGVVVANEPSRKRLTPLYTNLRRLGITNALVTTYSGQNFPQRKDFDRILVDAPCSGEGTWRGPNARPNPISEAARERLADRQLKILERGLDVLRPGGVLVYSTCTYAPEENELVVAQAIKNYNLTVLPLGIDLPAQPGLVNWEGQELPEQLALAARLYPHHFDSEGFFVVRLAR